MIIDVEVDTPENLLTWAVPLVRFDSIRLASLEKEYSVEDMLALAKNAGEFERLYRILL